VHDQLQVRELHAKWRRSRPQARAIIGIPVDLAEHGVEDVLELLLRQGVRAHLTLNLRSTLSPAADIGLDPADLVPDLPAALRDLIEELAGTIARARSGAGCGLEGALDRRAQRLGGLLGHGQLHESTLPSHRAHMLA